MLSHERIESQLFITLIKECYSHFGDNVGISISCDKRAKLSVLDLNIIKLIMAKFRKASSLFLFIIC